MDGGAWWAAVHVVAKSQTRLSDFTFTFHFPALEKEMATHSSVLAWRIPGTGEPGGLLSVGSHRVGHDWSDLAAAAIHSTFDHFCPCVIKSINLMFLYPLLLQPIFPAFPFSQVTVFGFCIPMCIDISLIFSWYLIWLHLIPWTFCIHILSWVTLFLNVLKSLHMDSWSQGQWTYNNLPAMKFLGKWGPSRDSVPRLPRDSSPLIKVLSWLHHYYVELESAIYKLEPRLTEH